jgi:excisionase family DNA binding protein
VLLTVKRIERGVDAMHEKPFLSTKEVAQFLDVNEKMVYTLVSEKGLPATKVTGKWLFPRHLVEQWIDTHIINHPSPSYTLSSQGALILAGSHDILLERVLGRYNQFYPEHLAVFGNVGSFGGVKALRQGICHIAPSHLLQDDDTEYNFEILSREFGAEVAAVVNFCRREQGILLAKDNPHAVQSVADLGKPGIRVANRPIGTGTRLLFDRELQKAQLDGAEIEGYGREFRSHMDVALEVLNGRADAAPAIRSAANLLCLDFFPLRWERYDFLIAKHRFFQQEVQRFLNLLHDEAIKKFAQELGGYDLSSCGKIMFPHSDKNENTD